MAILARPRTAARARIAALALLILLAACGRADPFAYSKQQLELQQQQLDAQRAEQRAQALEPLRTGAAAAWLIAAAAAPLIVLAVGLDVYRRRARPLISPDERGALPIPRDSITAVRFQQQQLEAAMIRAMDAWHAAQLAAAQRQQIDRMNVTISTPARPAVPALCTDSGQIEDNPLPTPTFRSMLDTGLIERGGPLILGFVDGQPLRGSWKDLYSNAVAGVQGSGKSVTMRFLACQAALQGGRFVVVDPHMQASPNDSLAASLAPLHHRMLCAPVSEPADILDSVRLMTSHLDARLKGKQDRTAIIFVVDEFTQTMRTPAVATELAMLLERLATEGRKVQLFACLGGQTWGVERSGGSPLRNALASAYIHRIRRAEAMKVLGLGGDTPQTHDLPTGSAWLYRTSGELVRVQMPLCTADDVRHVAALLSPRQQPMTIDLPPALPVAASEVADEAALEAASTPLRGHHKVLDARAARVRELVKAETPTKDILRELWGITTTDGDKYARAAAELRTIIAGLV